MTKHDEELTHGEHGRTIKPERTSSASEITAVTSGLAP